MKKKMKRSHVRKNKSVTERRGKGTRQGGGEIRAKEGKKRNQKERICCIKVLVHPRKDVKL